MNAMSDFKIKFYRYPGALVSYVTHRNTSARHTRWHYEEEGEMAETIEAINDDEPPGSTWEMVDKFNTDDI